MTSDTRFQQLQLQLRLSFFAIFGVFGLGIVGYMGLEGWSFLDSLYMTVITLAGVGYGETHTLDNWGRVFTILLILSGVVTLANLISQLTRAFAEGYFQEVFKDRRRMNQLAILKNHFIICGYGRIGQQVCKDFQDDNVSFVIIEREEEQVRRAEAAGLLVLQGDASSDPLLMAAGVDRANCILCGLPSDAENLYIVLSAKILNPKIRVISRASTEEGATKLIRVGADQVVSPYLTGAKRMAALALRPQVVDFVEAATVGKNTPFYIEELILDPARCPVLGKTLRETDLRGKSGALILAIRRVDGELIGGPTAETQFAAGDLLICMGTGDQLRSLARLISPGMG